MANSFKDHIMAILILPTTVIVLIPRLLTNNIPSIIILKSSNYLKPFSFVFLIIGLLLMISTIYLFATLGKGTLAPWNPTQKLVIQGPYKYCRNPMITGVLCILIAETLWFNNFVLLAWSLLFFIISTIYFITKEEPDLVKRFGEDYIHYKNHVPRWIPNLKPYVL